MTAPLKAADRRAAAQARRERRAQVTDVDILMEAAAAFLAVRPRSETEVRRRLRHLGYQATLADQVVERLVGLGYLDDRAFAVAWVESRDRARPRGVLALRQELRRKGVPRAVSDEVLAERASAPLEEPVTGQAAGRDRGGPRGADAELQAAARLLTRRSGTLQRESDPRRRQQRAYALLARHGFTPDVCRRAMLTAFEADPEQLEAET